MPPQRELLGKGCLHVGCTDYTNPLYSATRALHAATRAGHMARLLPLRGGGAVTVYPSALRWRWKKEWSPWAPRSSAVRQTPIRCVEPPISHHRIAPNASIRAANPPAFPVGPRFPTGRMVSRKRRLVERSVSHPERLLQRAFIRLIGGDDQDVPARNRTRTGGPQWRRPR